MERKFRPIPPSKRERERAPLSQEINELHIALRRLVIKDDQPHISLAPEWIMIVFPELAERLADRFSGTDAKTNFQLGQKRDALQ
jgi:hypothetical protein